MLLLLVQYNHYITVIVATLDKYSPASTAELVYTGSLRTAKFIRYLKSDIYEETCFVVWGPYEETCFVVWGPKISSDISD